VKRGRGGSVENLRCDGVDHEVERDRSQLHLLILRPAFSRGQVGTEPSLVHAHARFALRSLTVQRRRPVLVQAAAIEAAGKLSRILARAARVGRDDADDAQALVQISLVRLAVVAGVGDQGFEPMACDRRAGDLTQVRLIGRRSASAPRRQRQMRAVLDHLGKLGVFPVFSADAVKVVLRDVTRLKRGGVDRRQFVLLRVEQSQRPRLL
jgi:hypothetical protein